MPSAPFDPEQRMAGPLPALEKFRTGEEFVELRSKLPAGSVVALLTRWGGYRRAAGPVAIFSLFPFIRNLEPAPPPPYKPHGSSVRIPMNARSTAGVCW